jgi:UDP-N-acetylglucosamine 4,6-dehydratase
VAGNSYVGRNQTRFSVVRYGNVVGSRGSVIPFFKKCAKNGVLPITDPRMTRFWITLEQGVNFVLECLEQMVGGEMFVPKLPSMNIMNLAKAIGQNCKTEIVGIRPGEKLHEIMVPRDDALNTVEYETFYLIKPAFQFFKRRFCEDGCKKVPDDFEYNSGTNTHWLTVDEMKTMC